MVERVVQDGGYVGQLGRKLGIFSGKVVRMKRRISELEESINDAKILCKEIK